MCGICGVVGGGLSHQARQTAVERMSDSMVHRGPDDSGLELFADACLGMRRLAILDLTPLGHQPMANEDGSLWLVFNGEIYNFADLRPELEGRGHRFRSRTDSETIIHLYEEQGAGALEKLRGMFGLAVWDERRRELLLARDRLGIKPLYYAALNGGGVAFASEVRALLASGLVERRLNEAGLDEYLSFGFVPPPHTLVAGIQALPPGHAATWRNGGLLVRRWWSPPAPGSAGVTVEEAPARLRSMLEESIRLHRVSDVPVGAFLSGGIDSTAVVGLMSRTLDEQVRTFSVGFKDGPSHLNELTYAAVAAQAFNTAHSEIILTGRDVADTLPHAIQHLDQPSFDGLNTYVVSQATHRGGVTVALSGLGGDELFGGYDTFSVIPRLAGWMPLWRGLPAAARRLVGSGLTTLFAHPRHDDRRRKLSHLAAVDSPVGLYALARLTMWPAEKARLYGLSRQAAGDPLAQLASLVSPGSSPWSVVTALELNAYMGWRLLRDTDAMSMAHSLEVRVPLIDHKIVEFVCGLPSGWERRFGYPKRLLIESLRDVLPLALLNRPKQGFAFPMAHWMRHDLRDVVDDALSPASTRSRGLFDPDFVRALASEFFAGRRPFPVIWQLAVLELWLRETFDRPVEAAVTSRRASSARHQEVS